MKNVFLVLEGDKQLYFLQQENAEKRATETKGELFQEDISEKVYKEKLKEKGFFEDLPKNGKPKTEKTKKENTPDLSAELEALKAENEKLKAGQNLSFEDAAEVYKKKAAIFRKISVFEKTADTINDLDIKPSTGDEFNADYYSVSLNRGSYESNETKIFRISNIDFINSFIEYAMNRINIKIEELKTEVQAI